MRESVRAGFVGLVQEHEGRTSWMYRDTHPQGLVTCGIGNLIDPPSTALPLPWLRADGARASEKEVRVEWWRVKGMPRALVAARYRDEAAGLHLAEDAIDELVMAKLAEFWGQLCRYFPAAPTWPADGQLGLILHAWAVGPHAHRRYWPRLSAALDAGDWHRAAEEILIPKARPARNAAHQLCLRNAGAVAAAGELLADVLHYPEAVV